VQSNRARASDQMATGVNYSINTEEDTRMLPPLRIKVAPVTQAAGVLAIGLLSAGVGCSQTDFGNPGDVSRVERHAPAGIDAVDAVLIVRDDDGPEPPGSQAPSMNPSLPPKENRR